MSRSKFFAIAARRYLDDLDRESLTERINESLSLVAGDNDMSDAIAAGRRLLASGDW